MRGKAGEVRTITVQVDEATGKGKRRKRVRQEIEAEVYGGAFAVHRSVGEKPKRPWTVTVVAPALGLTGRWRKQEAVGIARELAADPELVAAAAAGVDAFQSLKLRIFVVLNKHRSPGDPLYGL